MAPHAAQRRRVPPGGFIQERLQHHRTPPTGPLTFATESHGQGAASLIYVSRIAFVPCCGVRVAPSLAIGSPAQGCPSEPTLESRRQRDHPRVSVDPGHGRRAVHASCSGLGARAGVRHQPIARSAMVGSRCEIATRKRAVLPVLATDPSRALDVSKFTQIPALSA